METDFWHERWVENQIGFHRESINPQLLRWWPSLGVQVNSRVLVPLCGKSLDMLWLSQQGYAVTGVELSPLAVEAFFRENNLPPDLTKGENLDRFVHGNIEIYCGDFFALDQTHTATLHAVYDRAALVALPAGMRKRYVKHLTDLLPADSHILLVTLDYDSNKMDGPPFAISPVEVERLYGGSFKIEHLAEEDVLADYPPFQEAGLNWMTEHVFMLTRL